MWGPVIKRRGGLGPLALFVVMGMGAASAGWAEDDAPLLERAEALDAGAVDALLEQAYADIGCALPRDLVTVFEVFLVDRAMTALGAPVGPEVARDGVFALRLRSTTIRHPEARAVLAVARALEGRVAADLRDGRLRDWGGLLEVAECEPAGTLFALSPYAGP